MERLIFLCGLMGILVGIAGTYLPEQIYYEVWSYYQTGTGMTESTGPFFFFEKTALPYTAVFLAIRVLLPALVLGTGLFWQYKSLILFSGITLLCSLSFESVLLYGALGMEGVFRYELIFLLPEMFYLLAVSRIYSCLRQTEKKKKVFGFLQMLLLQTGGALLEMTILYTETAKLHR